MSHRLLGSIVEPLRGKLDDGLSNEGFVLAHSELIWDLSWDVVHAGNEGSGRASRLLLMAMLESLFNLKAAAKHDAFYIAKAVEEATKYKRGLTDSQKGSSHPIQHSTPSIDQFISRFGQKPGVRQLDVSSVAKIARLAGMEENYRKNYAFYCMFTHPGILGLSLDDGCFRTGDICQELVFILLETSSFASSILLPPLASEYDKQVQKYAEKAKTMAAKGLFEKLNIPP